MDLLFWVTMAGVFALGIWVGIFLGIFLYL